MKRILIIDDEKAIRNTLKEILEFEDYNIETAENGYVGLDFVDQKPYDLIFCDIKMPKMDGLEFLDFLQKKNSEIPVIMISGHGNIETAVESLKKGAYDYIQKPLDLNRILVSVRNAFEKGDVIKENKILRKKIKTDNQNKIIGESKAILNIKQMINKVALTDARVLITGENGSGKELVAKQLHEKSNRNKNPFIEVNCAAIPSELIESELFGHEKGSFTSAHKQKSGQFEKANGGTLFLDEIGDMSASAQAKVLRALQENKIIRVGGEKQLNVDVRIIAATNKDLKKEIDNGNFREDLFHRLNVIPIHVPSLNERKNDIPILADYFLELICKEQGISKKKLNSSALEKLKKINWTGNIRELRNIIERLIILCDNEITAKDISLYSNEKLSK
ncbi:MAG: response regulator [Crocinitomicaceae bacterium]|nr:response regulator [Crocinitomicaceae bacterium]|tara:strand:+ start:10128 stop:11303 length:1176 start_codon:yes stop_codon:yes gene_type:complete